MKHIKIIGYVFAADILSLFIGLTLASSSAVFMRVISAVCTTGILICFMASHGLKSAREDMRLERTGETVFSPAEPIFLSLTASVPAAASWILLFISHSTASFDFYRWHKLINGYFLQIYNFINSDASAKALSQGQLFMMLPLMLVPALSFGISYAVGRKNGSGQ